MRWLTPALEVAQSVGFIAPRFIAARDGQFVTDGVTLEDWIEGVPATDSDRSEVATILSAFHEATLNWNQRPGFASSVDLLCESKGGDVALDVMPPELVRACRRRWKGLEAETRSVVHGDLTLENILRTPEGRLALIDWDESRVDAPLLDIAGLLDSNPGYPEGKWLCAKSALDAWEVAACWTREPEYARRRAEMMLAYT